MAEKRKYRVRPGFHHGTLSEYGPGDVVELEPDAAAGFADKLELVEAEEAEIEGEADRVIGKRRNK